MKGIGAAMFDINIWLNKRGGVPKVTPHGDVKRAAEEKGIRNVFLSLSSC